MTDAWKSALTRSEPDQATLDRVWAGVKVKERRRARRPLVIASAAVTVVGLAVAGWWWRPVAPAHGFEPVVRRERIDASLQPIPGVEVHAEPGALVFATTRAGQLTVEVLGGTVQVRAAPGAKCVVTSRRLSVDVAAAVLRLETTADGDAVQVEEGQVVVRREGQAANTLGAGQGYDTVSWRALAQAGNLAGAWARLGHSGVEREAASASVEEQTLLADIAATGHDALLASELLEAVVGSARATGPERALAAYDLGLRRLEAGAPARAAEAFEQSLSLPLPSALQRDARARAAEAWLRAGDTKRARRWLDAAER